jgi:hypothetical protein
MVNCSGAGEVLSFIAPTRPAGGLQPLPYVCYWRLADVDADAQDVRFQG